MKIDQDRGWKTIAGWIIAAIGGLLFALAGTEFRVVDERIAGGIVAFGWAWAGVGDRDAKAKQIRVARKSAITVEAWAQTVAGLAKAAGARRKKPGGG